MLASNNRYCPVFYPELFYRAGGGGYTKILTFNYYYKNYTVCSLYILHQYAARSSSCSGQLVYTSPLLTTRGLYSCRYMLYVLQYYCYSLTLEPHPFSRCIARRGAAQPRFSENTAVIQLMESSMLIFLYLSKFLCRYRLMTKTIASKIEHMYRLHHCLCSTVLLGLGLGCCHEI